MSPSTALTLEMTPDAPRVVRRDPNLAQASAHLPDGSYSTLRTYRTRGIVRLAAHLRRLEQSASSLGDAGVLDPRGVRDLLTTALDTTGHPESRLRLTFAPPRLFVSVELFVPPSRELYERGASCITLPRIHRDRPHVKDTHFIPTARRAYRDLPKGIEEGLLVGDDGSLLEGLTSNVFAVRDDALHTEGERGLAGITRALALDAARSRLPLVERAVRRDELPQVREAFITSASREILPVVRIDGDLVGDGRVGPHTESIMAAFAELVERETEMLG